LTIVLLVEGKTEVALRDALKSFMDARATQEGKLRVRLTTKPLDTSLLNPARVRDQIAMSVRDREVACVIGLLDVYPRFQSAHEAKAFLLRAAGEEPRFHAHAAQYEVEAWLLPFWDKICQKLRVQRQPPGGNPEEVDLQTPPSRHLSNLYRMAKRTYDKPRDVLAVLHDKDLTVIANQCPEFKALLNTLLLCAGLSILP